MPYSCCTIVTSKQLSTCTAAAALGADPFTRSCTTSGALHHVGSSSTRTTRARSPGPQRWANRAALKVASPHWVGGYVPSSAYALGMDPPLSAVAGRTLRRASGSSPDLTAEGNGRCARAHYGTCPAASTIPGRRARTAAWARAAGPYMRMRRSRADIPIGAASEPIAEQSRHLLRINEASAPYVPQEP